MESSAGARAPLVVSTLTLAAAARPHHALPPVWFVRVPAAAQVRTRRGGESERAGILFLLFCVPHTAAQLLNVTASYDCAKCYLSGGACSRCRPDSLFPQRK